MKKNRCLKIASGLLLLVLVTTCAIGTTLAKYTTGGDAQDSARVAKWGVKLEMEGDSMFSNRYKVSGSTVIVESESGTEKIVAPGTASTSTTTASTSTTAAVFSISGTPEVAVKINVALTVNNDIFLKKSTGGKYTDPTYAGKNSDVSTFDLGADYYPVVFTLRQIKDAEGDIDVDVPPIATGNLTVISNALSVYSSTASYAPNTNLTATFELSWAWALEKGTTDGEKALYNKADTYLGNLMAGINPDGLVECTDYPGFLLAEATEPGSDASYSTKLSYTLEITVTQAA